MGEATASRPVTGLTAAKRPVVPLRFSKMHGAGNDFVVLDLRNDAALAARLSDPGDDLCRMFADRRTGVGCDQVLGIDAARSTDAVAAYRIWNADGSSAQQCGNGARCVAAWLVRDGAAGGQEFRLDSPAGTHVVECDGDGSYTVEMGTPAFAPVAVPMAGFDVEQDAYALETENGRIEFGATSMGNPHVVIVVDDVDTAPLGTIGPMLQRDATFPESINVGFAEVIARDRIRLRVYERGSGETLACGSGACAAVAVLSRQDRVDGANGVVVSLPGGELRIHYDQTSGSMRMRGPATFVFDGVMPTG